MRIIEPRLHKTRPPHSTIVLKRFFLALFILSLLLVGFGVWRYLHFSSTQKPSSNKLANSKQAVASPTPTPTKTTLKVFTSAQFKNLYDTFAYPSTNEILDPPIISGNTAADQHIRELAVARGYRLRSTPKSPMPSYKGFTFQQKAVDSYKLLEKAAHDASIPLVIAAAFRSPEDQRELFMTRMSAAGITPAQIAAGGVDDAVRQLLALTAIPGYSRHHTGYTLDLGCDGYAVFVNSPCYTWLTQNNFEHAKTYGWVPSYPGGATDQGPEPEPWEFVWVGTDVLYE